MTCGAGQRGRAKSRRPFKPHRKSGSSHVWTRDNRPDEAPEFVEGQETLRPQQHFHHHRHLWELRVSCAPSHHGEAVPHPLLGLYLTQTEHPLQHRAQAIHSSQARPIIKPSGPAPLAFAPWPNLRFPDLLLPNPRRLFRSREIRAEPRKKRKGSGKNHLVSCRAAVFPRRTQGAEATK
jgi:hypothetical protein